MTIVIYYDEDKTNYHVVHPKTWSKEPNENFDGNIRKLVEHITKSDFERGIKNFYKFETF